MSCLVLPQQVQNTCGCRYIDYVGTWGPAITGHANEEISKALKAQIDKGTSFGAPCELEVGTPEV